MNALNFMELVSVPICKTISLGFAHFRGGPRRRNGKWVVRVEIIDMVTVAAVVTVAITVMIMITSRLWSRSLS
jgi:hypothetical protein